MKYIIVGDVHGDLNQFLYPLVEYLRDWKNTKLIYLGDYFDRGDSTVYIFEIISFIIKQRSEPIFKNIIMLRGNHESYRFVTFDILSSSLTRCENGMVSSFLVEEILKLDLPYFHYESDLNILFSHSKQTNPNLQSLLKESNEDKIFINDTYYSVSPKYKNIHGHDHLVSSEQQICALLTTDHIRSVSLDNDASYGFRVFTTINNYTKKDYIQSLYTKLFYIVFEHSNGNITNANIVSDTIYLNKNNDFNSKCFAYIKNVLSCICPPMNGMNCETSKTVFGKFMTNSDKKSVMSIISYIFNDYHYQNNIVSRICFNDIPLEFYNGDTDHNISPTEVFKRLITWHL